MSDGIYSPYKAALYPKHIASVAGRGRHQAPVHVQVIISDLCNQDCHFCAYRMTGNVSNQLFGRPDDHGRINPNRKIPTAKAKEILHDCAKMGVEAIQFTGGGEPTVHPDHLELFQLTADLGLSWSLVTNGTLMGHELQDALVESASWVRVSLDSGTPESYASVRNTAASGFDKVIANLASLSAKKRGAGSSLEIGVGFVVTPENWHDVKLAAQAAKDARADNIRLSAMFSQDGEHPYDEIHEECAALCREAETLSDESFTVINRFGDRIQDLRLHSPDYDICGYQHFTTYIGGDLSVYRCCNTAYNTRGLLGSLDGQSFFDLWFSDDVIRSFTAFDPRGCERCQFNGINRFIDSMASIPRDHAGFV